LFRRTKNVVIEFCLPERTVSAIFVREGGALFEVRDETKEIGLGRIPFGEEMKVIGHEAVGVKQERVTRRERNQVTQSHVAKRGVGEAWGPVVGARRIFFRSNGTCGRVTRKANYTKIVAPGFALV